MSKSWDITFTFELETLSFFIIKFLSSFFFGYSFLDSLFLLFKLAVILFFLMA